MFWSAGCSLFRAEAFSCSLGVLYGSLANWNFDFKKYKFKIFTIFGHKNPGSRTGCGSTIRKNAGSGSALNQCGSETLFLISNNGAIQQYKAHENKKRNSGTDYKFHNLTCFKESNPTICTHKLTKNVPNQNDVLEVFQQLKSIPWIRGTVFSLRRPVRNFISSGEKWSLHILSSALKVPSQLAAWWLVST